MWKDVSEPWKTVFEEAWLSFRNNSVPAGAAIYDSSEKLLVKDHNRFGDLSVPNYRVAHADANVINRLELRNSEDASKLTLYSSMEPCHMCIGSIYLTGIKTLRSAARDLYMGAAHFFYEDAFLRSKQIDYKSVGGEAELFTLVLQSYFEIKQITSTKNSAILECFRRTNETAVEIAEKMYFRRILDQWVIQGRKCEEVFDMIMKIKEEKYS